VSVVQPLPVPYVDLLGAIRVIVRLMPDGAELAKIMTDDWIKFGYWRGGKEGARRLDDDPEMIAMYGRDWRRTRPQVLSAMGDARCFLEATLPSGKVGGIGVSCAKEMEGPRKIQLDEWATLQLELTRNLLATPNSKRLEDFPAIRSIRVRTDDLQREWREGHEVTSPPAGAKSNKRRGRTFTYDQQLVRGELFRLMDCHDDFTPADRAWNCQARLEEALADFCEKKFGKRPAISTLRDRISPLLIEWHEKKRAGN
jgi:hypothetical protein